VEGLHAAKIARHAVVGEMTAQNSIDPLSLMGHVR